MKKIEAVIEKRLREAAYDRLVQEHIMSVRNTGMTKTAEEAVQSHTPVFLRSTV